MTHTMLERVLESAEDGSTVQKMLVQILSNVLLFVLIFGMSATVDVRRIKEQLRNCYAISTGVCMQFLIMPLLGFAAVIVLKRFGLTTPMGITLLIVTSSPGGSYSNWWCSLFNADLALSVAMTALSTLISIAALPANLLIYAHFAYGNEERDVLASVDFSKLLISLSIVICAILSGIYASYKIDSPKFQKISNAGGTISGILLIVVSGVFSTTGETDAKPWNQHWSFYVGVALPCVAGLVLANVIASFAKLKKPEVVTLSVECSYQNTGIATSAVLAMFDDPTEIAQAMAVPLFYGVIEMGAILLYCLITWKLGWTNAPANARLYDILFNKNGDIGENEDDDLTTLQGSVDGTDTLISNTDTNQDQVLRNRASSPNQPNENDNQNRTRPLFPIREESENGLFN